MFVGHYAPAFVAAALDRRSPPLGRLFVAAQLLNLAFVILVLLGVEHLRLVPGFTAVSPLDAWHAPYSHSLLGALALAAGWAVATRLLGGSWRAAHVGAAVAVAAWWLDLLVGPPDLTLLGHGPRFDLGLCDRLFIAMPLELALVALAATFYAARTRNRTGGWGASVALGALLAALAAVQLALWIGFRPAATLDPAPLRLPLTAFAVLAGLACLAAWTAQTRTPA